MSSSTRLTFGPFQIDLVNETLWRGPDRLTLKPKSFTVLRSLVERPQQLVTKDELLNTHWGDVAVGDAVLKTCIGEIRQALGEQASSPQFIETVHRRGYRFLATPTPVTPQTGSTANKSLVGREKELEQLHQWWEHAKHGERQVVFVTGEPGIGKTSLVNTFLDQIAISEDSWIGRGQCIEQYGAGEAYLPILEALQRLCREPKGDAFVQCLKEYAPTWAIQLPGLLDQAEVQRLLPSIIGATPVRVMRELAEAIEALTITHPLVLCFEDLHWLDTSSLDWLTYVARRSDPARLLIVGTYRPTDLILLKHPLKGIKQELQIHEHCRELGLECLTAEAVAEYLRTRIADRDEVSTSLYALAQVVHQRTEGNPLFMVNVTDYLMNHDLLVHENQEWQLRDNPAATTIPTGLRQFIDLRVDQLDSKDRQLLTVASVAGTEFSTATIAAALDHTIADIDLRLHDLVRQGQFIRNMGVVQWPDGTNTTTYDFQHALYQEALYDHAPETQRIELHRLIGERLEQGYGALAHTIAAKLALHFQRGQDDDRGSRYHQKAGEEAVKRSAYHEAILHLTKALELLQTLQSGPARDQRELILQSLIGVQYFLAKGFTAPEAGQALGRAHALCQQFSDNPQLLPILYGLLRYFMTMREAKMGKGLRDQIDKLAQQTGDTESFLVSLMSKGGVALFCGEPLVAHSFLQQCAEQEESVDTFSYYLKFGEDPRIVSRMFLSWVLWILGFPDQSIAQAKQALSRGSATGNSYTHAFALISKAICLLMQREYRQAFPLNEKGLALAQQHGYRQWKVEAHMLRGLIHTYLGSVGEAKTDQERSSTLRESIEDYTHLSCTQAFIAEATFLSCDYQVGLTMMQKELHLMEGNGIRWYEAEFTRLKGELMLALAQPDKMQAAKDAEGCFQEAIKIARKQEAKMFELRAIVSLARLWHQQGKGKQARPKLKKTYDWFTEGFDTKDLQEAKALLEELK